MLAKTDVQYWTRVCLAHMTHGGREKLAALGGDGQDTSFEQAFSNLAHAYLSDKAPTLLDHELGFQLIDRNNENTKAVGVFAFKVGSQQLFAPVFFLKGQLKGHELLYLRNQDRFVPMKENWLNSIINKKPDILGNSVTRQTSQLGVRQPDLSRMSQSPGKVASAIMPLIGHLATSSITDAVSELSKHCNERLNLTHFLKQASLPMLNTLVNTMQRFPVIADAYDKWHGIATLQDIVKEASDRLSHQSILDDPYAAVNKNQPYSIGSIFAEKLAADDDNGPDYTQKLQIITPEAATLDKLPPETTEAEREALLKDTVLIKDVRKDEEVSVPVNIQVEQRLFNPTQTGIYQVYTKDNELERCLVVVGPHGMHGGKVASVVVRLDSEKRTWGTYESDAVFATSSDESLLGGPESWQDWFDSLPDASTLNEDSKDSYNYYMFVGPNRTATLPFHVIEKFEADKDGSVVATVYMSDRMLDTAGSYVYAPYSASTSSVRIHLNMPSGTKLRSHDGDMYVPKSFKLFRLSAESRPSDSVGPVSPMEDTSVTRKKPIVPGSLRDATRFILEKTAALKIASIGRRYTVNDSKLLTQNQAIIHLVRDYGLRESATRSLLKQADARRFTNTAFRCRVKLANPYLTHGGPSAPGYYDDGAYGGANPMGWNGPTQNPYEQDQIVQDLSAANTDPRIYNVNPANFPEPMDANGVMSAVNSGQREVFDTSMIGSMLKAVRDDTMIDRYLPDLVTSLDRLGRLLFMFYWHGDKFADRYGKQDMPELEDSLRNSFEMIGDVVLFLKQKTIEPYPEQDVQDIDLGHSASN